MAASVIRKLGIVGHAAEKFSPETEAAARAIIREEIVFYRPTVIVSGRSPMGGVDLYAEEIAAEMGIFPLIYPPTMPTWGAPGGYKDRNLRIAVVSDLVVCVVVATLPPGYAGGLAFADCYHCWGRNPPHFKSGGCWTAWKAPQRKWRIIP